jgi:hypothetical protein
MPQLEMLTGLSSANNNVMPDPVLGQNLRVWGNLSLIFQLLLNMLAKPQHFFSGGRLLLS